MKDPEIWLPYRYSLIKKRKNKVQLQELLGLPVQGDTVQPYNEYTGEGNGFSFTNYNAHDMLYTIRRALSFYQDRKAWNNIMLNAVNSDYSWKASALEYQELYKKLVNS